MSLIILGINAYHGDSAACIVVDGTLIAAVEEERFKRIKHWAGFPAESIRYCLEEAGVQLEDVDFLAINTDPKANFLNKLIYIALKRPSFSLIRDRLSKGKEKKSIVDEFEQHFPNDKFIGQVRYVEHHLAHLASAHLVSPFQNSVTLSVDGFGDFSSGCSGIASGNNIQIDKKIHFPHSLGIFYQAFTQYLGFPHYGDEYKVMGLAPYGKPKYLEQLKRVLTSTRSGGYKLSLKYFNHHKGLVEHGNVDGVPLVSELFDLQSVENLLGFPPRQPNEEMKSCHFDLAHSIQAMYEDIFFSILNRLHNKYKIDNLTISGGCGNNSVANGKVYRNTPFKNLYIAASAGDSGGAIGAAYAAIAEDSRDNDKKIFTMNHAYLGPHYSDSYISLLIDDRRASLSEFTIEKATDEDSLCRTVARMISDDKVVGWFQGRMEWGPRALGNRSILADPRKKNMKDLINSKIKKRESFRPFAPSILREHVSDWFEEDDDVPFMMQVFMIKENKRDSLPAVTHVDGTGRLQTVSEKSNPLYYKLISAFNDISSVPILLNTSFNENEPVVCKPDEALDCFLRTSMDVVVLGQYIISR